MQQDEQGPAVAAARRMNDHCIGARVARLHRLVVHEFDQRLRPLGLSSPQLEILSTLITFSDPVKPTVVADRLGVERSTMSRNLALLQERGWVRATDVSSSGRSLAVTITDAGLDAVAGAADAWALAQDALVDRLGPDAQAILDGWLNAPAVRMPS